MKKQLQPRLFEWVVITILLFVLVIFAIPKFLDVGTEARIKTLNAIVLNLNSVNRLLYSRSVIKNIQNIALQSSDILGEKDAGVYLVYGELQAQQNDLKKYITNPLIKFSVTTTSGEIRLYLEKYKNEECYITYRQATLVSGSDAQSVVKRAQYHVKSEAC